MSNQPFSQKAGLWQNIARSWIRFSGPRFDTFNDTIEDQERLRRSRLISALLPIIAIAILISIPNAIEKPIDWIPLIIIAPLGVISLILNRQGLVITSGLFYIFAADIALTAIMVTQPHGIRNGNIPDFDLFVLPVLIAGIVLPRRFLFLIAIIHIALIITIFTIVPHDALLTQEIMVNQKGFAYAELSDAFLLQVTGAIIAWLSASSVDRALQRANRAEELAETRARLNEQNEQIVRQKERLDFGISILKDVQAQVANGNYSARARLQDNELVPLALSLNLMIDRLSRVTRTEQVHGRLEQALLYLVQSWDNKSTSTALAPLQYTGTIVDRIYPIFARCQQLNIVVTQSSSLLEHVHVGLQQQKISLKQVNTALAQAATSIQQLPLDDTGYSTSFAVGMPNSSRSQTPFPVKNETTPSFVRTVVSRLEKQVEEASTLCHQLQEMEGRSVQEIKQVHQWLKAG